MTERIKLIWDFHGPNAEPIATHHAKHLREFAANEKLQNSLTGIEKLSETHHIAYLVVEKVLMNTLRQTLKPHRGQVFTES